MKPKLNIPTTEQIVLEAYKRIETDNQEMLEPRFIREKFSAVVELFFQYAYEIYLSYENKIIERLTKDALGQTDKDTLTIPEVAVLLKDVVRDTVAIEKRLRQSRNARAGTTFEIIVQALLKEIGIQSERVKKEDKKSGLRRIDLVIPDIKTAIESPDNAHFLSLKTSLKDRWKLVGEDQRQGQRTHLATLLQREKLTAGVAQKIMDRGIFIYIPDQVKDECFPNNSLVRKISDLPSRLGGSSPNSGTGNVASQTR